MPRGTPEDRAERRSSSSKRRSMPAGPTLKTGLDKDKTPGFFSPTLNLRKSMIKHSMCVFHVLLLFLIHKTIITWLIDEFHVSG